MTKVAIIGLGSIGAGVAEALGRDKRFSLAGYDLRPEAFERVAGVMRAEASPAAASDSAEVVFVAVVNDAQVRTVLSGEDGVLSAGTPPKVIALLSTITIPTVYWAAEEAARRGVMLIDCGVSGPRGLAENAMVTMIGGDETAYAIARPVIEAFSKPAVYCGQLGNGMRTKLACNLVFFTGWMSAWEGARLALAAGVPLENFVEAVTAGEKWVHPRMGLVAAGVGLPPGAPATSRPGTAAFAQKDLGAALALGEELGLDLAAAKVALAAFPGVAGVE